ncbi:YqeB family protein [Rhizocola hellebori]|uniref:YqeB family protein n=1 Tax=Rhizocola hellebori TaxID=1392758 RepID=UPI001EF25226|nr:hypothetical protein [Rhizocola hellebori]
MREETTVSYSRAEWALIWLGFPLIGAGAGWGLQAAAGWVAGLAWAPFQGPFKLVASIDQPWATIGALALGAIAGVVVALLAAADVLQVRVGGDTVAVSRGGKPAREFPRASVTGVFQDAKHLVLLGEGTAELLREKHDLTEARLRQAFTAHGWPWLPDGDPWAGQYRRFVDDDPDLPPAANALLKARAVAVSKDDGHDLAELRQELTKLGVVVRDEKKRQYWRLVTD